MRLAIVGSRDFPHMFAVVCYVRSLPEGTVVVSGGARGVDTVAAMEANARGLTVVEHLPDWEGLGRGAGFERNTTIVSDSNAVVAFWDRESRGTLDTIRKAGRAGKLSWVMGPDRVMMPLDEWGMLVGWA